MKRVLGLLVLATLAGCGESQFEYDLGPSDGKPAPQAQPAPASQPAPAAAAPGQPEADGSAGDDEGPPDEHATEPRSEDHLRVLVLSGGGFHDFAGNLNKLLPGVAAREPCTFTELALHPSDGASPTSRRILESADLPAEFDAILCYTQGDLSLTDAMKDKLLAFVRGGGGLVGLHCAADSHPGWAGWDDLLRGRFERHPAFGDIKVSVNADVSGHPVIAGLPAEWLLKDEFYHLMNCAADDKTVLMSGVSPEGGAPRPVTWVRDYGKGRVVYTILGHGPETHGDPRYQQLVAQALKWAAGRS
jgi:Trehalose utilisation